MIARWMRRDPANGRAAVAALRELGFTLTDIEAEDIDRGEALVQIRIPLRIISACQ